MTVKPDSPIAKKYVASPNHDARESRVDILLLHYTGMQTADEALERLKDREARVSCHYFVDEDGRVTQMVPEARRAWHGGAGSWKGAVDINSRSIGIEIVNPGHEFGYRDFPDAQIDAVIALCRDIIKRRRIARERVLGHSDVAPARKKDPGEKFPWAKLAAAGVGFWVDPAPVTEGRTLSANDRGLRRGSAKTVDQVRLRPRGFAPLRRCDAPGRDRIPAPLPARTRGRARRSIDPGDAA